MAAGGTGRPLAGQYYEYRCCDGPLLVEYKCCKGPSTTSNTYDEDGDDDDGSDNGSDNIGVIIGVAVGAVFGGAVLIIVVTLVLRFGGKKQVIVSPAEMHLPTAVPMIPSQPSAVQPGGGIGQPNPSKPMKFCTGCGHRVDHGGKFCEGCGAPV